ncbi:MAG TPA: helix-turn-helix domain-containing protein [Candidatus Deferrimicrobium sp.]|nr:helix-turn-helix domain-containing protein [Candidatus Deferrimicrobium sp.]
MSDDNLKRYYDILELDYDASGEEINRAYKYLKNLYSKTSLATAPIDNEWNEADKQEILKQVEEAYIKLWPYAREEKADELTESPSITPLEEEYQMKEEPPGDRAVKDEYHPREEPAVSIDLDEGEAPQETPENRAQLFDSYVEEEVLFDLGTESEIDTEMEIEIDTKVDEVELKKEEAPQEKEVENKEEVKEIEKETGKDTDKALGKEDTLAEQFIGIKAQPITGSVFKKIREKLDLGFTELANSTQVPVNALEAIEAEAFDKLPEAGYLRYYVTSYARALALPDPKNAADQYMKRFREWKAGTESPELS